MTSAILAPFGFSANPTFMSDHDPGMEIPAFAPWRSRLLAFASWIKVAWLVAWRRYNLFLDGIGGRVTASVAKGAHGIDSVVGDIPWKLGGLDDRKTMIARGVLTEVVPKAAGDRVASIVDGVAFKAGAGGLGIALRLPLKPVIAPLLLVLGAVETVRAVRDIRKGISSVAKRVDVELEEAGLTQSQQSCP